MRTLFLGAAITFGLMTGGFLGTSSVAADPIVGTWATIKDDNGNSGHIKVAKCGELICGTLIASFDSAGKKFASANQGRQLVWDMQADGSGGYSGGKVYSPDRDKTYNGRMALKGDQLEVKGCVFGICRSGGAWTRVK